MDNWGFLVDQSTLTWYTYDHSCIRCDIENTHANMKEQETVVTCARHKNIETNLTCASCGTPICPKCLVQTPVGMKCPACASVKNGTLFSLSPVQALAASAVGLLAGAFAGYAVEFRLGWLFTLFLASVYGGFAGEMIMRAAGRKRGARMEIIAGVTLAVGAVGGRVLMAVIPSPLDVMSVITRLILPVPIPLIALAIVIGSAIAKIRYI